MLCGRGAIDRIVLQIDHIKPIKICPEKRLDQNNLQVLCAQRNRGKSNRTADWRPLESRLAVLMGEAIETE